MGTIKFKIDWNDDADYSDTNEDISEYVINANWRLGMSEPWQLVADESTCELFLDNSTGFFNPEGTSAIAGSVRPHRRVRIQSEYSGSTVSMWNGWLDHVEYDWQPAGTATGRQPIRLIASGPQQMLQDTPIHLPTYYTNVSIGTIIRDILAITQVPPVADNIWYLGISGKSELSSTTILADESAYSDIDAGDWALNNFVQYEAMSAWELITQLTETERGRFYMARDGRATFDRQQSRFKNPDEAVGTVSESYATKPNGLDYRYGYGVITSCRVNGAQRTIGEEETLWQLQGGVGVSGTVYLWATLQRRDGTYCTATGVRAEDISWYGGATGEVRVDDRGPAQLVTITSTAGTIVGLSLVGNPISNNDGISVETQSNVYLGTYGRRNTLEIDLPLLNDYQAMRRIANGEVGLHKNPIGELTRVNFITNDDGISNAHLRNWSIGTVLIADIPSLGHGGAYQIIGEAHSWTVGNIHTCDYILERNNASNPYLTDEEGGAQ